MKTKIIHITPNNMNRLFFGTQAQGGHTNEESRNKMKKILYSALQSELTDRQRTCLIEHYLNGKKEKDIALELFQDISQRQRKSSATLRRIICNTNLK